MSGVARGCVASGRALAADKSQLIPSRTYSDHCGSDELTDDESTEYKTQIIIRRSVLLFLLLWLCWFWQIRDYHLLHSNHCGLDELTPPLRRIRVCFTLVWMHFCWFVVNSVIDRVHGLIIWMFWKKRNIVAITQVFVVYLLSTGLRDKRRSEIPVSRMIFR
jgi:hypothetical protein